MKKIIVTLLSASMLFTMSPPAFAADLSDEEPLYSTNIDGHDIALSGTELYIDGNFVTDIVDKIVAENLDPITGEYVGATDTARRTGWVYGSNCPFGSASDYTRHVSTEYHNISLKKAVTNATIQAVIDCISDFLDMDTVPGPGSLLWNAASNIVTAIKDYIVNDKLYAREEIYGHKNGMGYVHKNVFYFYSDSNYSNYISSCTLYSQWA